MNTLESPSLTIEPTEHPLRVRVCLGSERRKQCLVYVDPSFLAKFGRAAPNRYQAVSEAFALVQEWEPRFQFPDVFNVKMFSRCFPHFEAELRRRWLRRSGAADA